MWRCLHCLLSSSASGFSFILALTIYPFLLLLFSKITPFVTKEAAFSENRDVSHAARKEAGRQAGRLQTVYHLCQQPPGNVYGLWGLSAL